jgi:putative membrane protein
VHLGRKYTFVQFAGWTRREAALLVAWAAAVTLFLQLTRWDFLTIPAPVLAIVGSALAIIIGFKNAQCYARATEALTLAGQLVSNSLVLAHRLQALLGRPGVLPAGDGLRGFFDRHLAWLTALRFALREPKPWENAVERGNARFLARRAPPERGTTLAEALGGYLPADQVEQVLRHGGDKATLILRSQHAAIDRLYHDERISEYGLLMLSAPLEDLARLQGGLMRIKSYPYARNFYSVAVFLVVLFVVLLPFGIYPYARELGETAGIGDWTGWLNVPLSAVVGWIFVALEKVGENSSNPFEGGANDVPISAIARRIEIELRAMLGEDAGLAPLEPQDDILF